MNTLCGVWFDMEDMTKPIQRIVVVVICALLGVALFLLLYGSQVLNPSYTEWLMDGGNVSKGYLGWRMFQSSDWQFPPGMMTSLGYPQQASVAATDAIPLVAVISKLFSAFHEEPFQYFGWWGVCCFLLQGVFGGLIALRLTRSVWRAMLGAILFLLSPVLWQNTFYAAGMAGHWVILAALLMLLCRRELSKRNVLSNVLWGMLGLISVGIHGKLALICGIFCMGYCIYAVMETRQWGKCVPLVIFALLASMTGLILGTFLAGGTGETLLFSVSPAALWSPHSYSRALYNFSATHEYQYASFAYLGFGALVLGALALVWWIRPYFSRGNMLRAMADDIRARRADVAAFGFVFVVCFALGMVQPVVYLLLTLILRALARKMSRRLMSVALVGCLCLQAYDMSAVLQTRRTQYDQIVQPSQAAGFEGWDTLLKTNDWSTVMVSPAVADSIHLAPLAEGVAERGIRLNTLSYANDEDIQKWENAIADPQDDMVFVFTAQELLAEEAFQSAFEQIKYLYQRDELVVGFAKQTLLPLQQILGTADIAFHYRYPVGGSRHLMGGEDIGARRYIYPGGLSYGPYLVLAPGQYEVRTTGEHLDEAEFRFTIKEGAMEQVETLSLPTERVYRLDVSETVTDFEVLIQNNTSQSLFWDAMTVTQLD